MTEAQHFFQEGLRLRRRGDEEGAQRVWSALIDAFKDVPAERAWVRQAEKERDAPPPKGAADRQWRSLREAARRARALKDEGKADEAKAILRGLRELYRHDPAAKKVLEAELGEKGKG
jgi:hypothetical protein